jgi:hypothetical protein
MKKNEKTFICELETIQLLEARVQFLGFLPVLYLTHRAFEDTITCQKYLEKMKMGSFNYF